MGGMCTATVGSHSVSADPDIIGSLKHYNTSLHLMLHENHYYDRQMFLRETSDQTVSQDQFEMASFVTVCHRAPSSTPNEPVTNRI